MSIKLPYLFIEVLLAIICVFEAILTYKNGLQFVSGLFSGITVIPIVIFLIILLDKRG